MKEKGFDKPVKYIFIGDPNTTKTTLARKAGLKVFETDGLTEEEVLNPQCYPRDTDVIVVGGKWIKHQVEVINLLSRLFKNDFQLIQVRFHLQLFNTIKFFIEKLEKESYSEGGYMVYIATDDRVLQIELDNDDGYRSHADPVPEEEVDGFKFWLRMEGGQEKVFSVEYDEILYEFKDGESRDVLIRAKFQGKIVFEIGTDNTDDYYPNYFMDCVDKSLEDILKEVGLE